MKKLIIGIICLLVIATNGTVLAAESVYKVIELVGISETSWEDAAKSAVETAGKTLKGLREAEVITLDMLIEDGKVVAYRAKIKLSFKYGGDN